MDVTGAMELRQRARDVREDADDVDAVHDASRPQRVRAELHDHEQLAVFLVRAEDLHDVRVREPSEVMHVALQARDAIGFRASDLLDRDRHAEERGAVDVPERPVADLLPLALAAQVRGVEVGAGIGHDPRRGVGKRVVSSANSLFGRRFSVATCVWMTFAEVPRHSVFHGARP
eukprot:31090-Pelagococcus_subviridis.AAC.2